MSPEAVFQEDMGLFLSSNHKRRQPTTPEVLEKVRLERALATYQERFREAGDFTFVIVGNVDVAKLQPLVETYLASLPTVGRKEKWRDIGVRWPRGGQSKTVFKGTEPKSRIMMAFHGTGEVEPARSRTTWTSWARCCRSGCASSCARSWAGSTAWARAAASPAGPGRSTPSRSASAARPRTSRPSRRRCSTRSPRSRRTASAPTTWTRSSRRAAARTRSASRRTASGRASCEDAYRYGEDPKQMLDIEPFLARVTSERVQAERAPLPQARRATCRASSSPRRAPRGRGPGGAPGDGRGELAGRELASEPGYFRDWLLRGGGAEQRNRRLGKTSRSRRLGARRLRAKLR